MKKSRRRFDYKHGDRKESTEWYINQFLFNMAEHATLKDLRSFREDIDRDGVARVIIGMPYKQFLNTIYWKVISNWVKKHKDYRCSVCGQMRP